MKQMISFCILVVTVSCSLLTSKVEYPILEGASDIQYRTDGVSYQMPHSPWLYFMLDKEFSNLLDSSEWRLLNSSSLPNGDRQVQFENSDGKIMRIRLSGIEPSPLVSGYLIDIYIEDTEDAN